MEKIKEAQLVEDPNAMPQPVQATPEEVVEAQPQAPLAEPPVAEAPVEAPVAEAPVEAPIEAQEEPAIKEPVDVAPELPNTPAEEQGEGIFKAPMEGMVPSGWVFPDELAQAVAMVTGDVEASETAPDATVAPTSPQLAPQEEPQRESVEATEEPLEEKVEDLDDKLDALIDKMRKADANGNKDEVEDCKKRMIKLLGMAMKEGKIDNIINDFATDQLKHTQKIGKTSMMSSQNLVTMMRRKQSNRHIQSSRKVVSVKVKNVKKSVKKLVKR